MLSKESKIRVLENFYGIDYVLFGKPLKSVDNCCPVIKEEYVSIKGALLSVYVEMLKLIDHTPKALEEKVDTKSLRKMAIESAKSARLASQKLVTTEQARVDIKNELKEMIDSNKNTDAPKIVENKIREKAFRLAVDNLLVARALTEAKEINTLNDWTGKIVEDSYKLLRDSLCETTMMILDNDQPND
jgi:hypothetical protein